MKNWYYSQNEEQKGPVPEEQLKQMIQAGQLPASSLVWTSGMEDWVAASTLPEFSNDSLTTSSSQIDHQSGAAAPLYAAPNTQVQVHGTYQPPVHMGPKPKDYLVVSIIVMVVNVLFSLVGVFMCCCLPFVIIPCGVVPIVYSCLVGSRYSAGDYVGSLRASSMAKGWCIGLAIVAGVLFLFAVLMLVLGGLQSLSEPAYDVGDF